MTKVLNCNDVTTTSLEIMDGKGNYFMFDLMMSSLQFFFLWKFGEYCAARIGTCLVLPGASPPPGWYQSFVSFRHAILCGLPLSLKNSRRLWFPEKAVLRRGFGLAHGMPLNIFCATRFTWYPICSRTTFPGIILQCCIPRNRVRRKRIIQLVKEFRSWTLSSSFNISWWLGWGHWNDRWTVVFSEANVFSLPQMVCQQPAAWENV